jgi:hypothetical protein
MEPSILLAAKEAGEAARAAAAGAGGASLQGVAVVERVGGGEPLLRKGAGWGLRESLLRACWHSFLALGLVICKL